MQRNQQQQEEEVSYENSEKDQKHSTSSSVDHKQPQPQRVGLRCVFESVCSASNQAQIAANISGSTLMSDKLVRMIAAVIKIIRNFNLAANLKPFQRLTLQITQLRRLMRVNRLAMLGKEFGQAISSINAHPNSNPKVSLNPPNPTWFNAFMKLFKSMMIVCDVCDLTAYLIQLGLLQRLSSLSPSLRKYVSNLYFLQCVGWLFVYLRAFIAAQSQDKPKALLLVFKWILDVVTSHNDYSRRAFQLHGKTITIIGAISSFINLAFIWKK